MDTIVRPGKDSSCDQDRPIHPNAPRGNQVARTNRHDTGRPQSPRMMLFVTDALAVGASPFRRLISGGPFRSLSFYFGFTLCQALGLSRRSPGQVRLSVSDHHVRRCREELPPSVARCERALFWLVEDPTGLEGSEEEGLVKFRMVRDQIEEPVTTCVAGRSIRPSPGEWARTTGAADGRP
jgi:hypothetical protein